MKAARWHEVESVLRAAPDPKIEARDNLLIPVEFYHDNVRKE